MAITRERLGELYGEHVGHLFAELIDSNKVKIPTAISGPQLPYMPWFPSDFYGHPMVGAMTDRQQNWYRRLLDKSWQMSEPCFLPNEMELLAGICRCTPLDLQGEGAIVLARFARTEDGKFLFNYRLLMLYVEARIPYEARVRGGKKTAEEKKKGKSPVSSAGSSPTSTPESTPPRYLDDNQNQNQNHIEQETGERAPEGLHQLQYARVLLDDLGLPDKGNIEVVASAIASYAKQKGITKAQAFEFIRSRALADRDAGTEINRFWFQDARYGVNANGRQPQFANAQQARVNSNTAVILDVFSRGDTPESGGGDIQVPVDACGGEVLERPARAVSRRSH